MSVLISWPIYLSNFPARVQSHWLFWNMHCKNQTFLKSIRTSTEMQSSFSCIWSITSREMGELNFSFEMLRFMMLPWNSGRTASMEYKNSIDSDAVNSVFLQLAMKKLFFGRKKLKKSQSVQHEKSEGVLVNGGSHLQTSRTFHQPTAGTSRYATVIHSSPVILSQEHWSLRASTRTVQTFHSF